MRSASLKPAALYLAILALGTSCAAVQDTLNTLAPAGAASAANDDLPAPELVASPTPLPDRDGAFVAPYLSSGMLAPWAQRAVEAGCTEDMFGSVKATDASWITTGLNVALGNRELVAVNEATLEAAGGWEGVRSSSDVTFNTIDELVVYLYANHGNDSSFPEALKLTQDIHPEAAGAYREAIQNAAQDAPGTAEDAAGAQVDRKLKQVDRRIEEAADDKGVKITPNSGYGRR